MPEYVVQRLTEALNWRGKALKGSKVLVLGLAYKPNIDDTRESPAFVLMDLVSSRGGSVSYYDPYVPIVRPTREHARWTGTTCVDWTEAEIRSYDAAIISTAHSAVNYGELASWADCIVDTRNAVAAVSTQSDQVWKA